MSKLRVHCFTISIDGYGAGRNQDLDNPLGVGGLAQVTGTTRRARNVRCDGARSRTHIRNVFSLSPARGPLSRAASADVAVPLFASSGGPSSEPRSVYTTIQDHAVRL
jgi:hypothetical protein